MKHWRCGAASPGGDSAGGAKAAFLNRADPAGHDRWVSKYAERWVAMLSD